MTAKGERFTVAGKEVWPDARRDKLRALWARDMPIKQIAHELGISEKSVKAMRAHLGLPPRKKMAGEKRTVRLNVYLTPSEMDSVRRQAQYHRRSSNSYVEMLLRRDGAI